jgi:hypothetical protein
VVVPLWSIPTTSHEERKGLFLHADRDKNYSQSPLPAERALTTYFLTTMRPVGLDYAPPCSPCAPSSAPPIDAEGEEESDRKAEFLLLLSDSVASSAPATASSPLRL